MTQAETAARTCLDGAEQGRMSFPEILAALGEAGFEGYAVDFRRGAVSYYHGAGDAIELPTHDRCQPIAKAFDAATMRTAIARAQANGPDYSYAVFCDTVRAAGCAGYIVSLPGRRVVYYDRTAELHVEHFPQ